MLVSNHRIAATSFVLLLLCAAIAAQQPSKPIKLESGKLQGVLTPDQKIVAYKGIPYAAPPLEDLRWRPPQPAGRWKGVFQARDFGPHCIQFMGWPDMVFHDTGPSEDCLTLNVWAPAEAKPVKKAGGLPVMVWIYGGGFLCGGTSEARQDGQFLARRGVIVVSMNYRLGIFGFLSLPELTNESVNHTSGNYGLMDQAAALAWVRRNIGAFGGDPDNVTLFGESAGSMSVSYQMASPVSNALFAKAVGESGGYVAGTTQLPMREQAEKIDASWAERSFGSARLFFLRQLPTDEIVKAAMDTVRVPAPLFGPIVDGSFLPETLPHIYADGKQAHIPLLAGWNADENHGTGQPTAATLADQATHDFGRQAQTFLSLFPASSDTAAQRSSFDYASDRFIAYSTWEWLETHAKTGHAPVYRYYFDLGSPGDRNHATSMGAFHSDDIEYVFGTLDSRPEMKIRPEDRSISELMQQYWVNFARTGNPNGAGLPQWPAYAPPADAQIMRLDAVPHAEHDRLRNRYLFLEKAWSVPSPQ